MDHLVILRGNFFFETPWLGQFNMVMRFEVSRHGRENRYEFGGPVSKETHAGRRLGSEKTIQCK